jgi:4-hydroxy 2-oxovalerate aldolase
VFAPAELLAELDITTQQPRNVGVAINEAGFALSPTQVTLPRLLSAAYALALCAQGGAKRVLVAGFDGFSVDDHRFQEMDDVFAKFAKLANAPQVVSITRTRFNIERSSMFAPL